MNSDMKKHRRYRVVLVNGAFDVYRGTEYIETFWTLPQAEKFVRDRNKYIQPLMKRKEKPPAMGETYEKIEIS